MARANLGKDVLLVDGDEQHTALTFTELRTEQLGSPGYTSVSLHGAALRTQVRQLTPKYDDIIIDVGGRDTGSLRAALEVLARVDAAAKRRGMSRSAWIQFTVSRALDQGEG